MTPDWRSVREEFPALAGWTYLNTASFGQIPRRAVDAVNAHFARRDRLACADFVQWYDDADAIRALIARLIHCVPDDIAFVPNASAALSLLLGGIDWQPGDRIVTLEDEFPNQLYYPSWLANRGVEFVESAFANVRAAIEHPRTRLVAVSTVNYSTGFRPPVEEISAWAHDREALVYIDGTQSLGALRFDVARVQPDMLGAHGYKWLLCPTGAGFMYVSSALREKLEPGVIGWRSDRGWRDPEHLSHGAPDFGPSAEKYEGGMLAFPVLYAMGASLKLILEIGPDAIERRVLEIAGKTRAVLRDAGAYIPDDCVSPIVCARFEGADAGALARELRARKIATAARQGNLRVSPHFYNDETDLERLAAALWDSGFRARTSLRTPPGSSRPAG